MEVSCDGNPVALPPSRRTRSLLAFLAITARPHRRDRLCEIFWQAPDDPRGALRWSLSKIRSLVNDSESERLLTDRERVTLLTQDIVIDIHSAASKVEDSSTTLIELLNINTQLEEPFLDGENLPEQELFEQWLGGEKKEIERVRGKLMARLSRHPDVAVPEQLDWARKWHAMEPYNPKAASQLLAHMNALEQTKEAEELRERLSERFRKAGIAWTYSHSKTLESDENDTKIEDFLPRQKIRFCTASDKVRIAYATVGEGQPIVKAANWLSHLEHDWRSPIWSPLFQELANEHQFIRYDERGNGLSDWEVDDISFESFVTDLETVVDACGVDKFALLGISQGAAVSIEYAVRHPERVTHLILFGGYAAGWRINATDAVIKEREAVMTLTETGWGQDNPAYRQIFSSTFMPSASASELAWFNEFQRLTTSPTNAVRFLSVFGDIDVRHQLAKVSVPTLVIHSLGDLRIPVSVGRDIAATIPNSQFVGLESDGHLLLGRESASNTFIEAVRDFVRSKPGKP